MQRVARLCITVAIVSSATFGLHAGAERPDPATLPGLTDSHYHLRGVGERELTLNLASARSLGDPRIEFHAATTRTDLDGYSGKGWHPEQAVTHEEAVKMFTVWPAYAAFEDE